MNIFTTFAKRNELFRSHSERNRPTVSSGRVRQPANERGREGVLSWKSNRSGL